MNETIKELEEQIRALEKKIENELRKEAAIQALRTTAAEYGYTLDELWFKEPRSSDRDRDRTDRKTRLKAMYQNPENKRQTWAGLDRPKPKWVLDYEAKGGNIEECRIPGA